MATVLSLGSRLDRYGESIWGQLAPFPMNRAHTLTERLADLREALVSEGWADEGEIAPPSADGRGQAISEVVLLRTKDPAIHHSYREWREELRALMARLHTPVTDPFFRTDDGDRVISNRGERARRSLPRWLTRHVDARDGDQCRICGVGPERPVQDPSGLISGGKGGWYEVRVGPTWRDTERVQGRDVAEARAAEIQGIPVRFETDHRIPARYGGPHMAWNLQRLCKSCNDRKAWFVWLETLAAAWERLEVLWEECGGG